MDDLKGTRTKQIDRSCQKPDEQHEEIIQFTSADLPANCQSSKTPKEHEQKQQNKPKQDQMPELNELKYSFCPEDEPSDLANETLMRATKPKKIGIFSTGGLSNKIVEQIQEQHSTYFDDLPFETHFETFGHSIIPHRKEKLTTDEYATQDQISKGADALESITTTTEIAVDDSIPIDEPMPDLVMEDDEFIFEPDPETEVDEIVNNTRVIEEPFSEKPISFRHRAQHIFNELKRRFGLLKPHRDDQESLPQDEDIGSDHEQDITIEASSTTINTPEITTLGRFAKIKSTSSPRSRSDQDPGTDEPTENGQEQPGEIALDKKQEMSIHDIMDDKDILFLFTCLDDEYDVENSLIISELAKKKNILTIVIASLPRFFGNVENVYATNKTLQRLRLIAEIVILLPYYETIKFKLLPRIIKELLEVIIYPGLINVDVADLKIVVKGGNVGVITFGEGRHATRHKDALFQAIDSKLLNVELGGVHKALLNVAGSQDITLAEVEGLADQIKNRIATGARFILGTSIIPAMNDQIKIFLLLGVTPMQVMVNMYANE